MKKLISVIMTIIMVMSTGVMTFAEDDTTYGSDEIKNYSDEIQTRTDGVTSWKVTSKQKVGTVTGVWQTGPTHKGPVNVSTTYDVIK